MKLKVSHNGIDYTQKMADFTSPSVEFDLSSEDIHIGFHKPLKKVYFEIDARDVDDSLVVKYWNGSAFVDVSDLEDGTNGLTQSGFISWPETTEQVLTDFDSSGKKYWVKFVVNSGPASVFINGINLVLSNDADLSFVPGVREYMPENTTSFIAFHQEARNLIVQMLRNSGKKIYKLGPNYPYDRSDTINHIDSRQVDQFDLLDIEEFRNASKYLALHLIFDHISKSDEDVYFQRSRRYYDRFLDSFNTNLVSIDTNDDGKTDADENQTVQFIRIKRE